MRPILYIIVPSYKDEKTLNYSVPHMLQKLDFLSERELISPESRLVLINDHSPDGTWETILQQIKKNPDRIVGINLSENCGEQNAILAGLSFAVERADCMVSMDSDLQDDIDAVDLFLREYRSGKDVVLGVRAKRTDDPLLERLFSAGFYLVMKIARTGLVTEHSNYRLLSRRAAKTLLDRVPTQFFLPCLASCLPYNRSIVKYERKPRVAGRSGYTVRKKLLLAKEAVFAHSPLFCRGKIQPTQNKILFRISEILNDPLGSE